MKLTTKLADKMDEAIERARDEAGPDDFGFNEEDGFLVGCVGFYGHNRIRNWEKREAECRKRLIKEAKKEHPGFVPADEVEGRDFTGTFTYSPDESVEDDWNVFFMVFVPEK